VKPRLLDLCCGQGGASRGYHDVGFDVTGVDLVPQPYYPYTFIQADALDYVAQHGTEYDAIHASFPCQAFTKAWKIRKNEHIDLVTPGRTLLQATGRPWVMENVPGSPLHDWIELCGCMFRDLNVYRERWFEPSPDVHLIQPPHRRHDQRITKMGRPPQPGERMHVVGNFSGVAAAKAAMGIEWMTREGLRESIPPAYARFTGAAVMTTVLLT
jgi:DNA (cytosine-5)-methyltransferase 1